MNGRWIIIEDTCDHTERCCSCSFTCYISDYAPSIVKPLHHISGALLSSRRGKVSQDRWKLKIWCLKPFSTPGQHSCPVHLSCPRHACTTCLSSLQCVQARSPQ